MQRFSNITLSMKKKKLFLMFHLFLFMCMIFYSVCVTVLRCGKGDDLTPETVVIGGCELSDVGAVNQTHVLGRISKCSSLH